MIRAPRGNNGSKKGPSGFARPSSFKTPVYAAPAGICISMEAEPILRSLHGKLQAIVNRPAPPATTR